MDIMTGLTAISETLKITKELRNIDSKVDVAELKLRLSDVVDRLLDAKEALQDAKEVERELKVEIERITNLLNDRGKYADEKGCLYELGKDGQRIGQPFCNLCYVRDEKLYRLKFTPADSDYPAYYICNNCNTTAGD